MGQESQSIDSVFDFLYIDRPRLSSWLAQLVADGVPVTLKRVRHHSDTSRGESGSSMDLAGEANAFMAKGSFKGNVSGKNATEAMTAFLSENNFDSSWSLPVNVLDTLDEAGMIRREIESATLGSIVQSTGSLQINDISFMQQAWDAMTNFISDREKITHANKQSLKSAKDHLTKIGAVLKVMPPDPQITMDRDDGNRIWGILRPENMVVSSSALALNHGRQLKGRWSILGILDALPDREDDAPEINQTSEIMNAVANVVAELRNTMGRDGTSYGVTPVLIFREIARESRQ